jgi:DUF971 family protein
LKPTAITLDRPHKVLLITWDDGEKCEYPLNILREACPCVECRGGHENMGKPVNVGDLLTIPLARTKSYDVVRIQPVGNYAIQPEWSDGHSTGIYTWGYLHDLCHDLAQAKDKPLYKPLGE